MCPGPLEMPLWSQCHCGCGGSHTVAHPLFYAFKNWILTFGFHSGDGKLGRALFLPVTTKTKTGLPALTVVLLADSESKDRLAPANVFLEPRRSKHLDFHSRESWGRWVCTRLEPGGAGCAQVCGHGLGQQGSRVCVPPGKHLSGRGSVPTQPGKASASPRTSAAETVFLDVPCWGQEPRSSVQGNCTSYP